MKILKIAFPILLALVILLCVLFPVLSACHTLILGPTVSAEFYYSTPSQMAQVNLLATGKLPIVSLLLPYHGVTNLLSIVTNSFVPFAIAIVCALIIALYIFMVKTKMSLYVSGSLSKVLKIASVVLLGVGILASLIIILPSAILSLYSFAFVIKYISFGFFPFVIGFLGFLMSLITVLVFILITASLAVLLVLLLKTKNESASGSKKTILVSALVSGIGAILTLLITLHYSYSRIASLVISFFSKYILYSINISYITAFFLTILLICVFLGFVIYLVKSIFAIKQLKFGEKALVDSEGTDVAEPQEALTEENEATSLAEEAV